MNHRLLALTLAGLFAAGAHAQSSPPGVAVPPNTPGVAGDTATRAGEIRKERRLTRMVKAPAGDLAKAAEGGAIGTDKAATAGEARAETRDARRPNKQRSTQGGTPK